MSKIFFDALSTVKRKLCGQPESETSSYEKIETSTFFEAIRLGQSDVVADFIAKGANVNARNKNGDTALIIAGRGYDPWVAGANCYPGQEPYREKDGDYVKIIAALVDKGADVNGQNKYGDTALIEAASRGHSNAAIALLDKGANMEIRNKKSDTALIIAAQRGNNFVCHTDYGHEVVVAILVSRGADRDAQNKYGITSLMAAAWSDYVHVAATLIDHGATLDICDRKGRTAAMVGSQYGRRVVALIEEAKKVMAERKQKLSQGLLIASGHSPR